MSAEGLDRLWAMLRPSFLLRAGVGGAGLDGPVISHGKIEGKAPPLAGQDLAAFDRRWANCKSDAARKKVVEDAIKAVGRHLTPSSDRLLRRDTLEWKVAIAADERSLRAVAESYDVSKTRVSEYRGKYHPRALAAAKADKPLSERNQIDRLLEELADVAESGEPSTKDPLVLGTIRTGGVR